MTYNRNTYDSKKKIYNNSIKNEIYESFKQKIDEIKKKTELEINKMKLDNMFSNEKSTYEETFRKSIVGLQTQKEFLKRRELSKHQNNKKSYKKNSFEKKKNKKLLTFNFDDEEDNLDDFKCDPKKPKKNPLIDTSFLPDVNRDKVKDKIKKELKEEFKELQNSLKKTVIEITFSYWDGSNHRRTMRLERGTLIVDFLEMARKELEKNFISLRGLHGSNLMFIKGDLIIGHSYNFQDVILSKALGLDKKKLFQLEEWEDIERNQTYFKDNAIQGKIVTQIWYERNKHIYPGNKWSNYDPCLHSSIKL